MQVSWIVKGPPVEARRLALFFFFPHEVSQVGSRPVPSVSLRDGLTPLPLPLPHVRSLQYPNRLLGYRGRWLPGQVQGVAT